MPNSTRTASSSHATDHSSSTGHTGPAGHKEPKRGGHHPATIKPAKPHSDKAHTDKVHSDKVHTEKVHAAKPHAEKVHTEKAHAEKSKPELVRRGPAMMAEPVQVAPVTHPAKAAHTTHAMHATHSAHAPAAHAATAAAATHIHVMPAAAASVTAVAGTATGVTFASIGLDAKLLKALGEEGYHTPTPIQAKAIGPVMAGNDVLGCAQTGTGKTAAFALPILHKLLSTPRAISTPSGGQAHSAGRGTVIPRVLILSPTRELAVQIAESFSTYGRHSGLTHAVIYGGVSQFNQVKALQRGVDIIVATPGRLMDLMQQRHLNLTKVEVFILDEADRMLDMGFIEPIRQIARSIPSPRQTLMFSATMPREIMHLADSLL